MTAGRPKHCIYTKELAEEVCEAVSTSSKSLRRIVEEHPHWPSHTQLRLMLAQQPEFWDLYLAAKRKQCDLLAEEIIDIPDLTDQTSDAIALSKLRVDSRKWMAARLLPKIYGEKTQQEITLRTHEDTLKELA